MTDRDRTPQSRECGGDVAAYALGALDTAEADAFVRHLNSCAVCRDELAAFQEVVNAIPISVPAHRASPELRRRVLRAIDHEPAPVGAPRRVARPRPRLSRWGVPRPALAFGAALAVAVLAFVAVSLTSSSTPPTRVIQAHVTGTGTAQLRIAPGQSELVVHRFAPPPAGQIYEVWLKRGKAAPSPTKALFSVTASGEGQVGVPGNLHGVSQVLVTPEPAGGTTVPTNPAVISASLT
ncbi:MAG TPA: anti-sigma factor [Solirubrobacteraceae bacterium]|jgi:anti-sigma-K factor RskA|nr:anti-sigma factor [Solirubrobacteraceae bacterium]